MIAREMDVSLDGDRLRWTPVEVSRHPCGHHEVRMIADEDMDTPRPEQASGLTVERQEIADVFIDQARRHEIVGRHLRALSRLHLPREDPRRCYALAPSLASCVLPPG